MKRLLTLCLALAGIAGLSSAQETNVEVTFYSPSIVRIQKIPADNNIDKQSLSVIMQPGQVKVTR